MCVCACSPVTTFTWLVSCGDYSEIAHLIQYYLLTLRRGRGDDGEKVCLKKRKKNLGKTG